MKSKPRTFERFPPQAVCPVCRTSEDGECILVSIDGTTDDNICEATPVHLWCAIATNHNPEVGIMYVRTTSL